MIGFIFKIIGNVFASQKTIGAGVGAILLALCDFINLLWPGTLPQLPQTDYQTAFSTLLAGLAAIGIGHKGNKVLTAIAANTAAVNAASTTGVQANGINTASGNSGTGAGVGTVSSGTGGTSGPTVSPSAS